MKCEEVRDEMIAYLKGELDEERRKEIEEHLARCQGCRRELEMSQRVLHQTQAANEPSVVRTVNEIVTDAIDAGASDIHIDPTRGGAEVRLRIDGVLHTRKQLSAQEHNAVVGRVKMMSEIPVAVPAVPQDGRVVVRREDVDYELRMSVMPFALGEKVVMRILSRGRPLLGLDKIGFLPEQLELVKSLIHQPCGMLIVAGPTGSGKTTTLYSMIEDLKNPQISVTTIEDPVELLLDGVEQAQVNPRAGLTFAAAIRAFLRQDPDVIMVGEMRDLETAELCMQASMTGHLVLGTLHTRDAVSVPRRLVDMGVEPWLVGTNLIGIAAQRLLRKVCPDCRQEYTPSGEGLEYLGLQDQVGKAKFYHGAGCENCRNTGYRNRTAVHEVLAMDQELARIISEGQTDPHAILGHALPKRFVRMNESARKIVLDGITTAEEAYRVLA